MAKEELPLTGALSPLPPQYLESLSQSTASNRLTTKKSSIKQQIKITFPQNNSKVKATDEGYVNVIIEGGIAPYTLYVDGIEQENAFSFKVTARGFYDLCAIDNDGDESLITIQVFT